MKHPVVQPMIEILPAARVADGMLTLFSAGFDTAEIAVMCRTHESEVMRLLAWRRDPAGFFAVAGPSDRAVPV